mmetsp:Transcript_21127/g.47900  ORF Transcript_21127/g.47900 Transcript_21127/m.47900 type:complete len:518 (-) Transcript_21127:277-1830(-)
MASSMGIFSSWLPAGDAFRISDLDRLQKETLPSFFRHSRFQSLVRQLNFYNFRKVNRERTFWVYRHPLFHRDRSKELHLLRRKTCPGVDGRKHKPDCDIDMLEAGTLDNGQPVSGSNSPIPFEHSKKFRKNGRSSPASKGYESIEDESHVEENSVANFALESETSVSNRNVVRDYDSRQAVAAESDSVLLRQLSKRSLKNHNSDGYSESRKQRRIEEDQQSIMVTQIAQKLQDYAKKATGRDDVSRARAGKKKNSANRDKQVALLSMISDTMKFNGVTYDDECSELSEASSPVRKLDSNNVFTVTPRIGGKVVTPSDSESDSISCNTIIDVAHHSHNGKTYSKNSDPTIVRFDTGKCILSTAVSCLAASSTKDNLPPPVENKILVASVMKKLATSKPCHRSLSGPLAAPLAEFCMETAPASVFIGPLIRSLLVNCRGIAEEFGSYRDALSPALKKRNIINLLDGSNSAIEEGIIREFKVFALNHLQELACDSFFNDLECATLKHCADVWHECILLSQ